MELGLLVFLFIGYQIYKAASNSGSSQSGGQKDSSFARGEKNAAAASRNSVFDRLSSLAKEDNINEYLSSLKKTPVSRPSSSPADRPAPARSGDYFQTSRQKPQRRDRPHKDDDPQKIDLFEVRPRLFH